MAGLSAIAGFLTITKISQKPIIAFDVNLENGNGHVAGKVLGIDGFKMEIEVRDDTDQPTNLLTVGNRITVYDYAGQAPGGNRNASYSAIISDCGWDAAPKTPAGRTLTVEKFLLIA